MDLLSINSYTGGTEIQAGTLRLGGNERLLTTGSLLVNGGTFDLNTFSQTLDSVVLGSGFILNGTLTGSDFSVQSGMVGAVLAGTAKVTKTTTGIVSFGANNNYSGGTELNAGTLRLDVNNALLATGAVTVKGGELALGTTSQTVGLLTLTSGLISGGTLAGAAYAFESGMVSSILSGTGALVKTTTGLLELAGANNYSGTTTVGVSGGAEAGVIRLSGAGKLSNAATRVFAGSLDLNGTDQTITTLALGGGAQPGGGIPLVMLSGYIASRAILADLGRTLPPSEAGHIS
jgi:autotransporter-associated beta strand protein